MHYSDGTSNISEETKIISSTTLPIPTTISNHHIENILKTKNSKKKNRKKERWEVREVTQVIMDKNIYHNYQQNMSFVRYH